MEVESLVAAARWVAEFIQSSSVLEDLNQLSAQLQQARKQPQALPQAEAIRLKIFESQRGAFTKLDPGARDAAIALGAASILGDALLTQLESIFAADALDPGRLHQRVAQLPKSLQQLQQRVSGISSSLNGLNLKPGIHTEELQEFEAILQFVFRDAVGVRSLAELQIRAKKVDDIFKLLSKFGRDFSAEVRIVRFDHGSLLVWLAKHYKAVVAISGAVAALTTSLKNVVDVANVLATPAAEQHLSEGTRESLRKDMERLQQKAIEAAAEELKKHISEDLRPEDRREAENAATEVSKGLCHFIVGGGDIQMFDPQRVISEEVQAALPDRSEVERQELIQKCKPASKSAKPRSWHARDRV